MGVEDLRELFAYAGRGASDDEDLLLLLDDAIEGLLPRRQDGHGICTSFRYREAIFGNSRWVFML